MIIPASEIKELVDRSYQKHFPKSDLGIWGDKEDTRPEEGLTAPYYNFYRKGIPYYLAFKENKIVCLMYSWSFSNLRTSFVMPVLSYENLELYLDEVFDKFKQ